MLQHSYKTNVRARIKMYIGAHARQGEDGRDQAQVSLCKVGLNAECCLQALGAECDASKGVDPRIIFTSIN